MRTTLRKRNFSSSNPRNTSPRRFKKRKLTPHFNNNINSNLSLSQTQLQSLHNQLLAIKNKHHSNQSNNTQTHNTNSINKNPISKSIQKTNTQTPKSKPKSNHNTTSKNTIATTKTDINSFLEIDDNQKHKKMYGPPIKKPKNKNVSIKSTPSDIKNNTQKHKHHKHKNVTIEAIPPEINNKNKNVSIEAIPPQISDDWNTFINAIDFTEQNTVNKLTNNINQSKTDNKYKTDLISKATATESEWLDFLDTRYNTDDNERDINWKPPNINTFWDQGPIGLIQNWWIDNNYKTYIGKTNNTLNEIENKKKKHIINNNNKYKKKQNKLIKMDIMKELKQQKLEKRLRDRIEKGELVKNITQSDSAFESFFNSALEIGNDIKNGLLTKEEKIEEKKQKKTKIIKPKMRAIKEIATFENDDLFFFEESSDNNSDDSDGVIGNINENDMIYMNENSIGKNMENVSVSESAIIASKINSENILLEQRVKMQHNEMIMGGDPSVVKENVKVNNNEIVSANILSDTVEDSMKEKRILKKLNVMDYVNNYKNAFFREVEELNLNAGVLVDNWDVVKKHDGLSRKLRKKLGIIMARERVKRKKKCKMEMMIDEMVNDESVSDDMNDVCEFIDE